MYCFCLEEYQYLDDESLALVTKVGMATTHFSTIGVYHYRVAESPDSLNTCSVIVNPGPKVRNNLAQLFAKIFVWVGNNLDLVFQGCPGRLSGW